MIYAYMQNADFQYWKTRLKEVEARLVQFCKENNLLIFRDRYYHETLAININTLEDQPGGNICLEFIDRKGPVSFRFALIKTHDLGRFRHFSKRTLIAECSLDYFEKDSEALLQEALDIYKTIRIDQLTSRIELPPTY